MDNQFILNNLQNLDFNYPQNIQQQNPNQNQQYSHTYNNLNNIPIQNNNTFQNLNYPINQSQFKKNLKGNHTAKQQNNKKIPSQDPRGPADNLQQKNYQNQYNYDINNPNFNQLTKNKAQMNQNNQFNQIQQNYNGQNKFQANQQHFGYGQDVYLQQNKFQQQQQSFQPQNFQQNQGFQLPSQAYQNPYQNKNNLNEQFNFNQNNLTNNQLNNQNNIIGAQNVHDFDNAQNFDGNKHDHYEYHHEVNGLQNISNHNLFNNNNNNNINMNGNQISNYGSNNNNYLLNDNFNLFNLNGNSVNSNQNHIQNQINNGQQSQNFLNNQPITTSQNFYTENYNKSNNNLSNNNFNNSYNFSNANFSNNFKSSSNSNGDSQNLFQIFDQQYPYISQQSLQQQQQQLQQLQLNSHNIPNNNHHINRGNFKSPTVHSAKLNNNYSNQNNQLFGSYNNINNNSSNSCDHITNSPNINHYGSNNINNNSNSGQKKIKRFNSLNEPHEFTNQTGVSCFNKNQVKSNFSNEQAQWNNNVDKTNTFSNSANEILRLQTNSDKNIVPQQQQQKSQNIQSISYIYQNNQNDQKGDVQIIVQKVENLQLNNSDNLNELTNSNNDVQNSNSIGNLQKSQEDFENKMNLNFNENAPTKVLLICIYNKNGTIITHNIFYKLFSKYGKVMKILIFEKSKIWKAFIEMDSIESATIAKNNLNNYVLINDGSRMNVYFSNIENISFQNNNTGGIDYTQLGQKYQHQLITKNPQQMIQADMNEYQFNLEISDSNNNTASQEISQPDLKLSSNQILNNNDTNKHLTSSNSNINGHKVPSINTLICKKMSNSTNFHQNNNVNSPYLQPNTVNSAEIQNKKDNNDPMINFSPQQKSNQQSKLYKQSSLDINFVNDIISPTTAKIMKSNYNNNSNTPQQVSNSNLSPYMIANSNNNNLQLIGQIDTFSKCSTQSTISVSEKLQSNNQNCNNSQNQQIIKINQNNPQQNFQKNKQDILNITDQMDNLTLQTSHNLIPSNEIDDYDELNDCIKQHIVHNQDYHSFNEGSYQESMNFSNSKKKETQQQNSSKQQSQYQLFDFNYEQKSQNLIFSNSQLTDGNESEQQQQLNVNNLIKSDVFIKKQVAQFNKQKSLEQNESNGNNNKFQDFLTIIDEQVIQQNNLNDSQNSISVGNNIVDESCKSLESIVKQGNQQQIKSILSKQQSSDQVIVANEQNDNNNKMRNEILNLDQNTIDNFTDEQLYLNDEINCNYQNGNYNKINNLNIYDENDQIDQLNQQGIDPAEYVNPLFLIENRKSKVIYIRGLDAKQIQIFQLYNLFSNFGNIQKMILIRNKSAALIEFENIQFATQAKDYLNNTVYMNNQIKIFYSNYSEINLKSQQYNQDEIFIGNQSTNRFKKQKQLSINPPSNVIHISNLKKEACNQQTIYEIFSQFGKIAAIKIMIMDNYKNMCLIKYNSLEESLMAISFLHGKEIFGRKILISFTRSKLQ